MLEAVRRSWMVLLVLITVTFGAVVVFRLHGLFGSDNEITRQGSGILNDATPFNPKRVTYEVFGSAGTLATINYLDLSANPQSLKRVPLPWSLTLITAAPTTSPNLLAQGNTNSVGCRITIDGKVKDEKMSHGVDAFTFCLVKSA